MSNNVFEKIEHQGDTIDQIAMKLEGVSIQDLYALAKRTLDYKDYEMAQKYYNNISLLNPLDWEAPFYASLCGEMGRAAIDVLWEQRPCNAFNYYKATVEYLLNSDASDEEKVESIVKASRILKTILKYYDETYNETKNKAKFDRYAPKFKLEIRNAYVGVYKYLSGISLGSFDNLIEEFSEQSGLPLREIQFDIIDTQKEIQIKTSGICYLEYIDKVLEKRHRTKTRISALLIAVTSIVLTCLMVVNKGKTLGFIYEILFFLYSAILILRLHFRKNGIRQDSWLNSVRKVTREISNKVVEEKCLSPMGLFEALFIGVAFFGVLIVFYVSNCGWTGFLLLVSQSIVVFRAIKIENSIFFNTPMLKKYKFKGKYYTI